MTLALRALWMAALLLVGCENTLINRDAGPSDGPDAGIDGGEGESGEGEGECGPVVDVPAVQMTFGSRPDGAANLLLICNNNNPVTLTVTPNGGAAIADAVAPADTTVCVWRVGFGQKGPLQVDLHVAGYQPYTNSITVDEDPCGRPITRTIQGVVLSP